MIPVGNKVIVEKLPDEEVTKSGLHIASTGPKITSKGKVVCCSREFSDNGTLRPTPFYAGNTVCYVTKAAAKLDEVSNLHCVEVNNILYVEE